MVSEDVRSRTRVRDPEGRMPLMDHIRELRRRLIISMAAILPAAGVGWFFYNPLVRVLTQPVCDVLRQHSTNGATCQGLVIQGVLGPFNFHLELALIIGVVVASPVWLYQLWRFVTPGLYGHERRWALTFVSASIPLFAGGIYACYTVLPSTTRILLGLTPTNVANLVTVNEYLVFVTRMFLVFGVAFELPLFVVMLNVVGVLRSEHLLRWWRVVVFLIFVFAALATPTGDPVTMSVLAVPMIVLFGLAYLFTILNDRRRARTAATTAQSTWDDDVASPLDTRPVPLDQGYDDLP